MTNSSWDSLFEPPSDPAVLPIRDPDNTLINKAEANVSDPTLPPDSDRLPIHPTRGMEISGLRARFRLIRTLGAGGMGMVWKAETLPSDAPDQIPSSQSGRPIPSLVAIKFMNPQGVGEHEATTIMRRELAPLLRLRGERVVPAVDWSLDGRHPFLAFEFFEHGSLDDLLQKHRDNGLPQADLLRLAEDLLVAVAGAHRCGLMHLDIKPPNILRDGHGGFLLGDFGIAQEFGEGTYQQLPGVGTKTYQAPEQAERRFDTFDNRTDLFGAGMTLYAAAVGTDPRALLELRQQYANAEYAMPPLAQQRPDLPAEFSSLIMDLIRNHRDSRPSHAAEVRELIRAVRHGAPVNQRPAEQLEARRVSDDEARQVIHAMVSDVWRQLLLERSTRGVVLRYGPNEYLTHEGDHSYTVFVLLAGRLEFLIGGKSVGIVDGEGDIVGEVSALTGHPRSASVRALTQVHVLAFNLSDFEAFVTTTPLVARRLLRTLCEYYLNARKMIAELTNPSGMD
jgi:serine/threonine protein kinase